MRRKIAIALGAALVLAALGIAIAFALSLPPLFEKPGQPIAYEAFWDAAERGEIAAISYDGTRSTLSVATVESGKTLDDLPQNRDYYIKVPLRQLWPDCNDWALRRQEAGLQADYGFAFRVEGSERRAAGFYNILPYLIMMPILALSIGVMLYVFVKVRRRNRTPNGG